MTAWSVLVPCDAVLHDTGGCFSRAVRFSLRRSVRVPASELTQQLERRFNGHAARRPCAQTDRQQVSQKRIQSRSHQNLLDKKTRKNPEVAIPAIPLGFANEGVGRAGGCPTRHRLLLSSMGDSQAHVQRMFAIRIVDLDVELVKPEPPLDPMNSPLTGQPLSRVPVIRVFGATPRGQKACVHVHGVTRHFFVPFDGPVPADPGALRQRLRELADDLNSELASAATGAGNGAGERGDGLDGVGDGGAGRGKLPAPGVFDMSLERRTPFYGYHEEARPFIKVQMTLPHTVDQAARLFARGFRGRLPSQPHEAHIPFLLQFKVDHNLLGTSSTAPASDTPAPDPACPARHDAAVPLSRRRHGFPAAGEPLVAWVAPNVLQVHRAPLACVLIARATDRRRDSIAR